MLLCISKEAVKVFSSLDVSVHYQEKKVKEKTTF